MVSDRKMNVYVSKSKSVQDNQDVVELLFVAGAEDSKQSQLHAVLLYEKVVLY